MTATANSDETTDLVMTGEAAQILGLSVESIRRLAKQGKLPFVLFKSGFRAFRKSDLAAFARSRNTARFPPGGGRPRKELTLSEE